MKLKTKIIILAVFYLLQMSCISEARVSVIGSLTRQKEARPGETYKGSILIKNTSTEPQEVKVYQTDYLFFFDGRNIYNEPGTIPRSNANWINFNPRLRIIPSGEILLVNYTVTVPNDPNLVGTYWSSFMVEGVPKSSPLSSQPKEDEAKVGITQIFRYNIQMVTHIGGTGEQKLNFLNSKLLKEPEKTILQVDIENIGQRWLRPYLWIDIYDQSGSHIGKFKGGRKRIYPGTSTRYRIDLSMVPKASHKALLIADCGGDSVFGVNYTLKFEK